MSGVVTPIAVNAGMNTGECVARFLAAQGVRVAGSEVNTGSEQQSFAQQNGQSPRATSIAEFERPSFQSPEPTPPNEPQNGRFA